jgi:hypothetical protein
MRADTVHSGPFQPLPTMAGDSSISGVTTTLSATVAGSA